MKYLTANCNNIHITLKCHKNQGKLSNSTKEKKRNQNKSVVGYNILFSNGTDSNIQSNICNQGRIEESGPISPLTHPLSCNTFKGGPHFPPWSNSLPS